MAKIFISLFVLVLFISCNNKQQTVILDINEAKTEVDSFISEWHKEAADADFDTYFGKIAEDGIYIGTDETERWTKDDYISFAKPYFDKGTTWNFKAKERIISFSGDIKYAWFDELLDTWMGACIGSGVLRKKDDGWEIVHYVLSLKVPNEKMRDVINVISTEKK